MTRRPDPRGAWGSAAEEAAARALRRDGYRVLLRNARTPRGEIDLVALRRGTFCFVEVKARRVGGAAGSPEEALTPRKLARVAGAAQHLLRSRGLPDAPREFLGAAVDLSPEGEPLAVRFHPVEEIR